MRRRRTNFTEVQDPQRYLRGRPAARFLYHTANAAQYSPPKTAAEASSAATAAALQPNPEAGSDPSLHDRSVDQQVLQTLLFAYIPHRLLAYCAHCMQVGGYRGGGKYQACNDCPEEELSRLQQKNYAASHFAVRQRPQAAGEDSAPVPLSDEYNPDLDLLLYEAGTSPARLLYALCRISPDGRGEVGSINNAVARSMLKIFDHSLSAKLQSSDEKARSLAVRMFLDYGVSRKSMILALGVRGSIFKDLQQDAAQLRLTAAADQPQIRELRRRSSYWPLFITVGINFYEIIENFMTRQLPEYFTGRRVSSQFYVPIAAIGAYDAMRSLIDMAPCFKPWLELNGLNLVPTYMEFERELSRLLLGRADFAVCRQEYLDSSGRTQICRTRYICDPEDGCSPACPGCALRHEFRRRQQRQAAANGPR